MTDVRLPKTLGEFSETFTSHSRTYVDRLKKCSLSALTPTQETILNYSGRALMLGRPLDTVMIFMAGSSGAGKSATINQLFEDNELCSTSASTSETKEPVLLRKSLKVTKVTPPVVGNLAFVDVPGSFDTDAKNEATNFASIAKFRESSFELLSRETTECGGVEVATTVFPNIILFVLKASDNRTIGPDSFFRKSLDCFKLYNLFDKNHPNLIVVVSHARNLGANHEDFILELEEIANNVRRVTQEVLGVSDVEVVPVENNGKKQGLEKKGDFYFLPNGELSHYNLFQAMLKVFMRNDDLMGRLFTGWYFGSDCPEKKNKVEVKTSEMQLSPLDVAVAGQALEKLQMPLKKESIVPQYNFSSLGHGFCPVTEAVKHEFLLNETGDVSSPNQSKIVEFENSRFLLPDFIIPYISKSSRFQRLSFYDKEEYQNHKKNSYGIEAGFKLSVSAGAEGRWIAGEQRSNREGSVKMVQEIQVATLKLDNPRERLTNARFIHELISLPSQFTNETAIRFRNFFSRWGTHLICEQGVGGSIQLKGSLRGSSLTETKLQEIEGKISSIFQGILGTPKIETGSLATGLKASGVTQEELKIEGGDPPTISSLEGVNPSELQNWVKTIPKKPVELLQSIKLYPYYDLLDNGPRCESLRQATKEHLATNLNSRSHTHALVSRNEASENAIWDVINAIKNAGPQILAGLGGLVMLALGFLKAIR